jgi:acylphosphatase
LGLSGWVRNLPNGDVEVWAEGSTVKLNDFLQWLRDGPPGARVDCLHYENAAPTGQYSKFTVSR